MSNKENSKEPVRLRQRSMPSGNTSLYLDIYAGGRRSYEYLRLYLVPEKTRADKEKNRETLKLADAIRAKRVIEVRMDSTVSSNNSQQTPVSSTTTEAYARSGLERKAVGTGATGSLVYIT